METFYATYIKDGEETFNIHGQEITVKCRVRHSAESKEKVYDRHLEEEAYEIAMKEYKKITA